MGHPRGVESINIKLLQCYCGMQYMNVEKKNGFLIQRYKSYTEFSEFAF